MAGLRYEHLFLLLLLFFQTPGALGGRSNGTETPTDQNWTPEDDGDLRDTILRAVGISAGYLALYIIVPVILCGGFSLCAYIFFKCCYKGKTTTLGPPGIHPEWTHFVVPEPEFCGHGFWAASSGLRITSQNTVVRHHERAFQTDGARWSHGFTSGRHVFEITWSRAQRGAYATVGVATADAPLSVISNKSLVGDNKESWGFDVTRRRALHRGQVVGSMRMKDGFVPDTFFMYLNMEDGKIGFGTEERFYGYLLNNIPTDQPLYPMIGTMMPDASITMSYTGSAPDMDGPPSWAVGAAGGITVGAPELYALEKSAFPSGGCYPGHAVPVGEVALPDYQTAMEEGHLALQPPPAPGSGAPQAPPSPPPPYSANHQKY